MPYCPKCRYEYKQGIIDCPECEVPLVGSLSELADLAGSEDGETYENWVALARLTSPQYVGMLEEVLRDDNIPVVVVRGAGYFEVTGQMGLTSFAPGGGAYTLMVPEEFVADADAHGLSIMGEDWAKSRLVDIEESE
jgi:hypothetical protein